MAPIGVGGPSTLFQFDTEDVYQVPARVSEAMGKPDWHKYLSSLGFGCKEAFGALRGTALDRYSTIMDRAEKQERVRALYNEQTRALTRAARTDHMTTCDICPSPDRISPDCPRKQDAKNLKWAFNGFKTWDELYRPYVPRKDELETRYATVRIEQGVTAKAVTYLLPNQPYMRYEPGDYLLQVVEENKATDKQRAVGVLSQPSDSARFHLSDDILVPDGIVPFQPHEDLERIDEIRPTILKIAIAILGFKPGATRLVPDTLRAVLENPELSHKQWEKVVEMWDFKFKQASQIPACIRFSVAEARTKLGEAAWIIRRLRAERTLMEDLPQRDNQLKSMEKLLCRMTETTLDKLADQHLKHLGQEARDCICDGNPDRVLIYMDGAFDKNVFRDIHHRYKEDRGHLQPAALNAQEYEEYRDSALRIIGDTERANEIVSEVSEKFPDRDLLDEFLARLDENHDINATTVEVGDSSPISAPESERESEPAPEPESEPAPEPELEPAPEPVQPPKRGRPKKKEGDPKGPYTKRRKAEHPTNPTSAGKYSTPPHSSPLLRKE